jgi:hypothetical protein
MRRVLDGWLRLAPHYEGGAASHKRALDGCRAPLPGRNERGGGVFEFGDTMDDLA